MCNLAGISGMCTVCKVTSGVATGGGGGGRAPVLSQEPVWRFTVIRREVGNGVGGGCTTLCFLIIYLVLMVTEEAVTVKNTDSGL